MLHRLKRTAAIPSVARRSQHPRAVAAARSSRRRKRRELFRGSL